MALQKAGTDFWKALPTARPKPVPCGIGAGPGLPGTLRGRVVRAVTGGERRFIRELDFAEAWPKPWPARFPPLTSWPRVRDDHEGRAVPGMDAAGETGLWVVTEMEAFRCRQCGHCCRSLGRAFAASVKVENLDRWEAEGRFDILEWVDLRLRDVGMMDLWTTRPRATE